MAVDLQNLHLFTGDAHGYVKVRRCAIMTDNRSLNKFKYMYCRISVFENIYNYHYIVCENPIESGFFIFSGFCTSERAKIKFNENVLPVGYMCRMILIGYKYNIVKHLR